MQIIRTAAIVAALMLTSGADNRNGVQAQTAPSPEAVQAARDLVAVITKDSMRQLATQVTAQVWPRIEQSIRAKQSVTPAQVSELRTEYERIQVEFISKVMDDAPVIYARYFAASELRELLAFYRTPIGEKSLRVLPQITAEAMGLVMPRMQQLQTQVMEAFVKVLKQRGLDI
jgi:uncharacterized protein